MRTRELTAALCLLALPALARAGEPAPATAEEAPQAREMSEKESVEDDDYEVRLSLPTEDDRAAWAQPGLRIELSVDEGMLFGRGPAPRIYATAFNLRARVRMDERWSLASTVGYSIAGGAYEGLRWAALVEPVFHPLPEIGLSLGLGYGGLNVEQASGELRPPPGNSETGSRTLGDDEHIYSCAGGGWVARARGEYLWVVGPLFSTGPYLSLDGQWTGCEEGLGKADRETGQQALGRQWWLNLGGAIGWWLSWR